MAVLDVYGAFDQRTFNLGNIFSGIYDSYFIDDQPIENAWLNDNYTALYTIGDTNLSASLLGDYIEYDGEGTITGGFVESFEIYYLDPFSETYYPAFLLYDFTFDAAAFFNTLLSLDSLDERQMLATVLSGDDIFYLSDENDFAQGLGGNDAMYGYAGDDTLSGSSGRDTIVGGAGADTISGGFGNDLLIGDIGKDLLTGGDGVDTFVLDKMTDSSASASSADIIRGFAQGYDKIKLSSIDAFASGGTSNDTFVWRGTSSFSSTTAGEVRYKKYDNEGTSNDYTMVFIDNDADTTAEMSIRVNGLYTFTASDFIL